MKAVRNDLELMQAKEVLLAMESDPAFITKSSYSANGDLWVDHRISFIDVHLLYLKSHPQVNAGHYISNLRLRLRKTNSPRY